MTLERLIKAFLAGLAFPAVFLPFAFTLIYFSNNAILSETHFPLAVLYIPLLFGMANIIYQYTDSFCPLKGTKWRLWTNGAILGIIVASLGVFVWHVPEIVFGLDNDFKYFPFILLPIVYGIIFRYVVGYLNELFEIQLY